MQECIIEIYPGSQHGKLKYNDSATSANLHGRTIYMLLIMTQNFLEDVRSLGRLLYLAGLVA